MTTGQRWPKLNVFDGGVEARRLRPTDKKLKAGEASVLKVPEGHVLRGAKRRADKRRLAKRAGAC